VLNCPPLLMQRVWLARPRKAMGWTGAVCCVGSRGWEQRHYLVSLYFTCRARQHLLPMRRHDRVSLTDTSRMCPFPVSAGLRAPSSASAIGQLPEFGGDARFAQHLVLKVPNMEEAVTFYTKGLNMQVSHEGRCVVLVRALG
jgi:hypothetical protein